MRQYGHVKARLRGQAHPRCQRRPGHGLGSPIFSVCIFSHVCTVIWVASLVTMYQRICPVQDWQSPNLAPKFVASLNGWLAGWLARRGIWALLRLG